MIVLDTNVISELARQTPDPGVLSWLDSLEVSDVATTAVTAAELRYGVARLPDGHRKRELTVVIHGILTEDFHGRVLPFDERASVRYAEIVTGRERIGRPSASPTLRSQPSAATWTPFWPPATPPTSRKHWSNSLILGSSADHVRARTAGLMVTNAQLA